MSDEATATEPEEQEEAPGPGLVSKWSVWWKDPELVGAAISWQGLKLEIPPIFNMEVLSDHLLKKFGFERNNLGIMSRASWDEWGRTTFNRPAPPPTAEDVNARVTETNAQVTQTNTQVAQTSTQLTQTNEAVTNLTQSVQALDGEITRLRNDLGG
ncbi:hypothetical protein ABTY20_04945 [Streptomyces sp. NPDC126497]|uniref:hypothetical protein n=1 Tax=Streptomyces sp. NPDC126497 TaxID=3155313 RepID=UPI003325EFCA